MGCSIFFRAQVFQVWLLSVCVILCLRLTVDAIICSECTLPLLTAGCNDTCEASGEYSGCMTREVFSVPDGDWEKTQLTCYDIDNLDKCGATWFLDDRKRHEFQCCSNKDYCNELYSLF